MKHALVPVVAPAGHIVRPRAHVDGLQRQRRALVGHAQALRGLVFIGDVEHDAEGAGRAVGVALALAANLHPAQLAVAAPRAHLELQALAAGSAGGGQRHRGDAVAVVFEGVLAQRFAQRRRPARRVAREQHVHVRVPLGPTLVERA